MSPPAVANHRHRQPWAARGRSAGPLLLAAALAALLPPAPARAADASDLPRSQVVYGSDDRREVFSLTGARAAAAASTVALVSASRLFAGGSNAQRLATTPLGQRLGLCAGERFAKQPTAAGCSGVLVGADIVATAGHCVDENDLADTRFVFGFRLTGPGQPRTTIPNADIYRGARLLSRRLDDSTGADYAVVQLDRRVTGRTPQKINRGAPPKIGTPLYVIGHPSGLPTKIAAGAKLARSNATFFEANLDTFGGNSGSPVFDANTNTVVGILVRGAADYRRQGACQVVNVLPDSSAGEDATNTRLFAGAVPQR